MHNLISLLYITENRKSYKKMENHLGKIFQSGLRLTQFDLKGRAKEHVTENTGFKWDDFNIFLFDNEIEDFYGQSFLESIKALNPVCSNILLLKKEKIEKILCSSDQIFPYDYYVQIPLKTTDLKMAMICALKDHEKKKARLREKDDLNYSKQLLIKKVKILSQINGLSKEINSATVFDTLLDKVFHSLKELMSPQKASLMLYNEEEQCLETKAVIGWSKDEIPRFYPKLGQGLAGTVLKTGNPILSGDVNMEEFFFNPEKNLWRGSRNLMCVPIKVHEKVLGVLNISDKTTNEPYTEEDLEILCILANHIGIAFSNIFLKEENIMNERLKLAGVMLGTIAHDFRNPLTGIKGYTELLKHGIESVDSRTALEYLNNISMLSERLTTMVNDLLCFISGKNEEVRRDVIQIGKFFNEVLPQIKYLLKNTQIELRTCIDEGGEIEVDKNGFIRALINIVTNSKEAMSVGGILDIDVNVAQNHVEMKFRDNGCGMPSNIQDSIFKPFITYGKKKGIGLGLAIVNQFVKDHDGRLHIESKPGQGTCVTIILPLKPHSKRRDSEEFHQGSSKPQLKIIKENAEFGIR